MLKRLLIIEAFTVIFFTSYAGSNLNKFEGSINLIKETVYDTSYVKIQVKGSHVRLDEFNSKMNLTSIFIIDLESEKVFALSPKRKLFYELKSKRSSQSTFEDTTVLRTENRMVLDGNSCCQMRVKSVSRDTETSFWVASKNYYFFQMMNKILGNIKSDINIFSYFPNTSGTFPMLMVERTLLRKEKMKVQVTEIIEVLLSESLFKVPPGYQKIEQ